MPIRYHVPAEIVLESVPVEEGLAPADRDGVGLLVTEFERLVDEVGVVVGDPDGDAVHVAVPDGVLATGTPLILAPRVGA